MTYCQGSCSISSTLWIYIRGFTAFRSEKFSASVPWQEVVSWTLKVFKITLNFKWFDAPVCGGLAWRAVHCSVCPISIVPIPSSNEEIRLVDDAFGKISHMVSDGSWMVRVQAAKTLVREQDNTHRCRCKLTQKQWRMWHLLSFRQIGRFTVGGTTLHMSESLWLNALEHVNQVTLFSVHVNS